ncbi:hypothetical protein QTJ16_001434 [Diplocarpon rosae]|uniref:HTH APSES-type domain-containing protein n=1 Tax=Diplocarpon rosae TaxID=946125 RepID=A0AAD9T814_9HELO|nr:hypothetical protein QTJ16_001434 [Diplocarpon rosae]
MRKTKMNKDGAVFAKGKIKGEVRFPPFERLDEDVLREVQKFQIYPLGNIQEYSRHIPYNSEKKSFLEKTGRESFEVFQYVFKVPGDEKEYVVMWDYNIGLVRITPFFKCCKYSKTTPAKMLNMNPGLKEITHSITGGALAAQGYWMPYSCALAVCATFCSHMAAALIPIFGPSFPSLCAPPEAPEHGRMIIDTQIIRRARSDAEAFRLSYSSPSLFPSASSSRDSYSPVHLSDARRTPPRASATSSAKLALGRRLRLKRAFGGDGESPYHLATDTDLDTPSEDSGSGDAYFLSPVSPSPQPKLSPSQRHPRQHPADSSVDIAPHPLLSAIPRSTGLEMDLRWRTGGGKRRAEDADDEYDGEDDNNNNSSSSSNNASLGPESAGAEAEAAGGAEKKAAWLLMNLSVQDGECGASTDCGLGEGPRIKRRRATSM